MSDPLSYLQDIKGLRVPRCAVCSTDWYKKPSADIRKCSDMTNDTNPSSPRDELILLPPCSCTHLKIVSCPPLSNNGSDVVFYPLFEAALKQKLILERRNALAQTFSQFSSSLTLSSVRTLSHNAMCRVCLELFVQASGQVEKQVGTATPFSTPLNCPTCRRKYMPRELAKVLMDPLRVTAVFLPLHTVSNVKSKDPDPGSFAQMIHHTVTTVRFWKNIKRIVQQSLERARKDMMVHLSSSESGLEWMDMESIHGWNLFHDEDVRNSSDSCFSSGEEDLQDEDSPIARHKKGQSSSSSRHRVEMKQGELREELIRKDSKYRQEVEDEKFLLSMSCESLGLVGTLSEPMDYAQYLEAQTVEEKKRQKQIEEDRIMAETLQKDIHVASEKSTTDEKQSPTVGVLLTPFDGGNRKRRKNNTLNDGDIVVKSNKKKNYNQRKICLDDNKCSYTSPSALREVKEPVVTPSLQLMMDMGFTRKDSECALRDANNDVDLAVSMLLSMQ